MEKKEYKEILINHIEALEKGYDNLIIVLSEDIEKDEEGKITLSEEKIKIFCEGIERCSDALDKQLARIKAKKEELEKLINPEKEAEKVKEKTESYQNKHLK